jgi:hypothetical protein
MDKNFFPPTAWVFLSKISLAESSDWDREGSADVNNKNKAMEKIWD